MTEAKSPADELARTVLARPHAARRSFWVLVVVGIVAMLMSSMLFDVHGTLFASPSLGTIADEAPWLIAFVSMLGVGAFLVLYGRYGLKLVPGVQLTNAAVNQIALGKYAIAEDLIAHAEARAPLRVIRRAVALHRAAISFGRGDAAGAAHHVDAALAISSTPLDRTSYGVVRFRALSLRALSKALAEDDSGARSDIDRVRALARTTSFGATVMVGEGVLVEPLARVALAEAIVLARAGDNDALRAQLEAKRTLILEGSQPRDRALLRGLERMLQTRATSPYRKAEKRAPVPSSDEPAIEDWIQRVLPEVAELVPRQPKRLVEESVPAAAVTSPPPRRAVPPRGSKARGRPVPVAVGIASAALLLLVVAAAIMRTSVDPGLGTPSLARTVDGALGTFIEMLPVVLGIACVAALGARVWATSRDRKAVLRAYLDIADGARTSANERLESVVRSAQPIYVAVASLALARAAWRVGSFGEALEHAERGLANAAQRGARALLGDIAEPELATERAAALALRGRSEQALAELAALPPGFAYRSRSDFRVRLMAFVGSGKMADAVELVQKRGGTLPVDTRTELIADLVRAVHTPDGIGLREMERLSADLRSAETRAFVTSAAPSLLRDFQALRDAGEDATPARAEPGAEAEAEAEASELDAHDEVDSERPKRRGRRVQ